MSGFQIVTAEMETASRALPGSDAFLFHPQLGSSWDEKIHERADETESFGTAIADLSADHQSTDDHVVVRLRRLGGALGVK